MLLQVFAAPQDADAPAGFLGYVQVPRAIFLETEMLDEIADQLSIESRGLSFKEQEDGSIALSRRGEILYLLEEVRIDST